MSTKMIKMPERELNRIHNSMVQEVVVDGEADSWIVGGHLLIKHTADSPYDWADGKGGGFVICDAPEPLPALRPLSLRSSFMRWPGMTRPHVSIEFAKQQGLSVPVPNIIFHAEHAGIYFLVTDCSVPRSAVRLLLGWHKCMAEPARQRAVERMVDIFLELCAFPVPAGAKITGVDGGDFVLAMMMPGRRQEAWDCHPDFLQKRMMDKGFDCSELVFFNAGLNTHDMLVDPNTGDVVKLYDWTRCGFVPHDYPISYMKHCNSFMVHHDEDADGEPSPESLELHWELKKRILPLLEKRGYVANDAAMELIRKEKRA
ncbi:hypothetical protein S40293_07432 [Stachybotrys chartarum IBT 40293]|nr:hypothetical protein S40293_07432 [Stachybotrys chartarum IBT 40293]